MIAVQKGARNDGWKYETQIIAALATRWANDNTVKDFWIATSVENVRYFDDVIAILTLKNGNSYLFMVQLKHSSKSMRLVHNNNTRNDPKCYNIPLHKYEQGYNDIVTGNFNATLMKKIGTLGILQNNTFFCIFTTMTKSSDLTEMSMPQDSPLTFLDLCSRCKYAQWDINVPTGFNNFFQQLYFFTDQWKSEKIPELLQPNLPGDFDKPTMDTFLNLIDDSNPLTKDLYCERCVEAQIPIENEEISIRIKDEFFDMWDQIFETFNLVEVEKDETLNVSSLLASFYEYKIRREYNHDFNWNDCCKGNKIVRGLVNSNQNLQHINHLSDLLRHMWREGKIPILMKQCTRNILSSPILAKVFNKYRFIVVSDPKIIINFDKNRRFKNVFDVKEKTIMDRLLTIRISFQGRPSVCLDKIVGNSIDIFKAINPSHIFRWTSEDQPSLGRYLITPEENYIPRLFDEVVTDNDVKNITNACTPADSITSEEKALYEKQVIQQSFPGLTAMINKVGLGKYSSPLLQHESSSSCTDNHTKELSEKQFLQQIPRGLTAIINKAGMGKTTTLNSLAFQCGPDYAVHYNLADSIENIKSIDYFFNKQEGETRSKLIEAIYKSQKETGRLFVIIDSLDEIPFHRKERSLEIIDSLLEVKVKHLIAARTYASDILKQKYPRIKLFRLKKLTDADIEGYLSSCNKSKTIYERIDADILSTPLHLNMISKMPDDARYECVTDLYELFIKNIIDVYLKGKKNLDEIDRERYSKVIRKDHERAALKFIFEDNSKFKKVVENTDYNLRMGIIFSISDDDVRFVHHAYAEFLAAKWFLDKPDKSKEISKKVITNIQYHQVCKFLLELLIKKNNWRKMLEDEDYVCNPNEFFMRDQWGLLPIHWAMVNCYVTDSDKEEQAVKWIEKICVCMTTTEERLSDILRIFNDPESYSNEIWFGNSLHFACKWGREKLVNILLESFEMPLHSLNIVGNSCLHHACSRGNVNIVRSLLENHVDVNQPRKNGVTSLHIACEEGQEEIANALLEYGADPDLKNDEGYSSFHDACHAGHMSIVLLLLNHKADVQQLAPGEETSLHRACIGKNVEIVRTLLSVCKMNVNQPRNDGVTSLHMACVIGRQDIVEVLLEFEADPNLKCNGGVTSLHIACDNGYENIVHLLLTKGADLNQPMDDGGTSLHVACNRGNINIVQYLLKYGANVNQVRKNGMTGLHIACQKEQEDIAKILLEYNADPNLKWYKGTTSLHLACGVAHTNMVLLLLACNADCHQLTDDGETCLHIASAKGNVEIVRSLLKRRVNVNHTRNDGATALHIACQRGEENTVRVLLEMNADPNIRCIGGFTSLHMASEAGYVSIVLLLLDYKAQPLQVTDDGHNCLHIASANGHIDITRCMLEKQVDVNIASNDGMTSLHIACKNGQEDVVRLLLLSSADPNKKCDGGMTSLFMACRFGNINIVSLLLDYDADPHQLADDGLNCLYEACSNGHVRIVHCLLEKHVDVNQSRTSDGMTCLYVACKNGHGDTVKILLEHNADPNLKCDGGFTSLHAACVVGDTNMAMTLLAHNADPHQMTDDKETCLHAACFNGNVNLLYRLLEKDVNVDQARVDGLTSLHIACTTGRECVVQILLEHNADPNLKCNGQCTGLHIASYAGHANLVLLLLEHKADAYQLTDDGETCLHRACTNGHLEVVQCLLKNTTLLNETSKTGSTSLYIACEKGDEAVVKTLLECNADPNIKCARGYTGLHIACKKGNEAVVKVLLEYNPDLNIKCGEGYTTLQTAVRAGHTNISKMLLDYGINNDQLRYDVYYCLGKEL